MADRTVNLPAEWADGAPDIGGGTPSPGTTYRNSTILDSIIEAAWPFSQVVNSADFNEIMGRVTALLILIQNYGLLPWGAVTDYPIGAKVMGSNGKVYRSLVTPNVNNQPTTNPTEWAVDRIHDHADDAGGGNTLNIPTISDLTNAQHDHSNVVNGGLLSTAIRDISRNLVITNGGTPDEEMDIDASELILQSTGGVSKRISGINFTVDNTASGENGIFNGSVAPSTWYAIWITNGASGSTSGLHLSDDLSTVLGDAPAGFNLYGALVGWIRTDGTSDFIVLYQRGHRVSFLETIVLSAGVSTTYAAVGISATVPSTVKKIGGSVAVYDTNNRAEGRIAAASDGLGNKLILIEALASTTGVTLWTPFVLILKEIQNFYYKATSGDAMDIRLSEFEY